MAQWTTDQIIARIRSEADRQKVDPDLAVAVATQESYLNPNARGDNGNSLGLFQLQPAAAIDVGVNPQWRHEPDVNIYGGVKYLGQKLTQANGNVKEALRRFNGGGDPNYVQNVMRFFRPGVAEAAESRRAGTYTDADVQQALQALQAPAPPQGGTYSDEDVQQAMAALQGTPAPPAPGVTPQPTAPTATSTPEQDAAYRASVGQREPPSPPSPPSPAPTAQTSPGASQGQATPYTPPGEQQPSDLVIDIEKPAAPQATGGVLPLPPQDQPLEEGFTRPSTLIPLLMGGAGIKAVAPVWRGAEPWAGRLLRPLAEGLSQTLGFGAGRVAETGQLPSPGELATELAVTTATGRVLEDIGAVGADFLRRSQGGKAIIAADEATRAAQTTWQTETQAAEQAAKSQQKDLYDTAVIKARAAQREYEMAARARRETIAANQVEYDQAVRANYQAKDLARTQEIARRQQEYAGAIAGQEQAITQARAIPGRYAPETPSWVLYEKYADAAKDAVVDLAPAKAALQELRVQRGTLPDGTVRPFPKPVEDIAAKLDKATGETPFETIRQEIRKLGPLSRSSEGNVRGPAKQLMGIYADVLDAAPIANDALKTANATFRREMAVRDMDDWLKPGHGVVARDRFGREKINVPALFKKIDKTMTDDSLFRGSFSPQERAALEADIGTLAGTPTMPTGPPKTPPAVPVPQQRPPSEPGPATLPGAIHVAQVPSPLAKAAPTPTTPLAQLGPRPPVVATAGSLSLMLLAANQLGVPLSVTAKIAGANAVLLAGQQARWLMAHALLDPGRRKLMQAAIDGQGILNPRFYGVMLATLSPAERKAYARETEGKAR